ncbi:helix-turn-helix domain-containing protein [Paenibacillus assamensis]|uniref:helix-turn-helix domain-containing protein n=1 Tax=Paenibacillus assamensis TaxID=311244 RepID=UPI000407C1F5|nr:helix-turn-helix domain-containing protein [Paenibacillus assamensis]
MNVKEAAKILGVHERTIYNMIKDGRLKASKDNESKWDISEEQLSTVMERGEIGRELAISSQVLHVHMNRKKKQLVDQTLNVFKKYVREFEKEDSAIDQEMLLGLVMDELTELKEEYNEVQALRKVIDRLMDESIEKLSVLDDIYE